MKVPSNTDYSMIMHSPLTHMPPCRKQNLLTPAAAEGEQNAVHLARFQSSSPAVLPASITTSRINFPKEGFVMTKRKKIPNQAPPELHSVEGSLHQMKEVPQLLPHQHSPFGGSQLFLALSIRFEKLNRLPQHQGNRSVSYGYFFPCHGKLIPAGEMMCLQQHQQVIFVSVGFCAFETSRFLDIEGG